ncbi:hypothetical protein ACX0G9_10855 [Flavitalea flava]
MKKALPIANGIALIITIIINYLSNKGGFNGTTIAAVSAKYPALFTPAGYAFSIWGLIYLGLICFVVFQLRGLWSKPGTITKAETDVLTRQTGWWFVLSCLANSAWVLAWVFEFTGLSVLIMVVLLFSLLKIILRTDMELTDPPLRTIAFVWWPFSLYAGWISVALIANVSAWLVKINWNGFGIGEVSWAIIMILVAGGINLFMTWMRNMREYAFVGVWALVAVGVANRDRESPVAPTAFFVAGILFLSSCIHGYRNRKFSPWRKRPAL